MEQRDWTSAACWPGASLMGISPPYAEIAMQVPINIHPNRPFVFTRKPSSDIDRDFLNDVIVIAGRIEDQFGRLRGSAHVAGARHDGHATDLLRREPIFPRAK